MRKDVFVYISGPMTACNGRTIEQHIAVGVKAHCDLLNAGIPNFCPHLGGAFPTAWQCVTWERWLVYDEAVIERSTHLIMLPNWQESKGAVREHEYAVKLGLPIAYSMEELFEILGI